MKSVKIRNICNDIGIGAFYHSAGYIPQSHTLPFEPYIGDTQLKLDQTLEVTEDIFQKLLPYLNDLREARIVSFDAPENRSINELTLQDMCNMTVKDVLKLECKQEQLVSPITLVSEELSKLDEEKNFIKKELEDLKSVEETTIEIPKEEEKLASLTDPETSPLYVDSVYKSKISNFKKKKK